LSRLGDRGFPIGGRISLVRRTDEGDRAAHSPDRGAGECHPVHA
jgi:hypothetical protein